MTGGRLLTVAQVADYLQIPVQTLYLWHHRGTGPNAIKVGRHLRYRQADLDAWVQSLVDQNRIGSTRGHRRRGPDRLRRPAATGGPDQHQERSVLHGPHRTAGPRPMASKISRPRREGAVQDVRSEGRHRALPGDRRVGQIERLARQLETVPADSEALLFVGSRGAPLRYQSFRRAIWDRVVTSAGLPEGLTPHHLRHTDASLLEMTGGADPVAVQRHLGRKDVSTTLNIYAGLFPNRLEEIAVALDAIYYRESRSEIHRGVYTAWEVRQEPVEGAQ